MAEGTKMDCRIRMKELLQNTRYTVDDMAIEIRKSMPDSLFKYRRFDDYLSDNLKGIIYRSKVSDFNDPFDCLVNFDIDRFILSDIGKRKLKEKFPIVNWDDIGDVRDLKMEIIQGFQKDIRVACFSETFDSILMWSHYAQNHSGYCIEYDMNKVSTGHNFFPIIYSSERNDITEEMIENQYTVGLRSILYKALEWEYEKEWRVYKIISENNGDRKLNIKKSIKAIYLGARCSKENEKKIKELIPNIPIYRMKISEEKYKLIKGN